MQRLSLPLGRLSSHYDVIVVGSGYGGGIAASRLARAGRRVCLLERGPERQPGEFPDTALEANAELQAHTATRDIGSPTALFDFHVDDDIVVLTGCGLGGTSLINANVSLRADARVFDDPVWPAAFRADTTGLAAAYERAEAMLRPTPYPEHLPALEKYRALQRSGARLGLPVRTLPINVTFADGVNHVGVEQRACTLCGDCVSGCNHQAKNTTLMNYLPDAVNYGAELFTCVDVQHIARRDGGGWVVHVNAVDVGREKFDAPTMTVSADLVVLGAGALGSSQILLRSRAAGVATSSRLGSRFSGNGDVLGFAYNADQIINGIGMGSRDVEPGKEIGPCITGMIDGRNTTALNDGFIIEDGDVPGPIGALNPGMYVAATPFIGDNTSHARSAAQAFRAMQSLVTGAHTGATARTQTFLVMSHDDSGGTLSLQEKRLRVTWPDVGKQPHFERIDDQLRAASAAIGAVYVRNPLWTSMLGDRLITVHPLGGCPMGERAEDGVVNHKGQVFCSESGDAVWPDLYVVDGSTLPRSVGVNPLLTISAVAERSMAMLAAERGWTIDYALPSRPATPRPEATPAIAFTETMRGFWSRGDADFARAETEGKAAGREFAFTLTVRGDDAHALIEQPPHVGSMFGTVTAPDLCAEPLTVANGVFNLITDDPDSPTERRMRYRMTMHAPDGRAWHFDGYKRVRPGSVLHAWPDTSTLFITIREGTSDAGAVVGRGILHIRVADFQRQLSTMRVTGAKDTAQRLSLLAGFGQVFAGVLYQAYGSVFGQTTAFRETAVPRKRRTLALPAPEIHPIVTSDNTTLRLTRYEGGAKGPVIVAPGFGMGAGAYLLDTIDENLTEHLVAAGYDVWLFEYRSSPDLESSAQPYSIDDIATIDWPAAVAEVQRVTAANDVQVVAHCVGSMSFLMAQLAGMTGVRAAVLSALTAHPRAPALTEIKAGLRLPSVLNAIGFDTLSTTRDEPKWYDKALDQVMRVFPTKERCHSPVCRKILFMYGEVYDHAQLNRDTHEALPDLFGVAHMRPFAQLARATHAGHLVDEHGKDAYMPNVAKLAIPLTFLHGEHNTMFLPEGSQLTVDWLRAHNEPSLYRRTIIPGYGHLDCFIGKDAARDVFPLIVDALDRAQPAGVAAPHSLPAPESRRVTTA